MVWGLTLLDGFNGRQQVSKHAVTCRILPTPSSFRVKLALAFPLSNEGTSFKKWTCKTVCHNCVTFIAFSVSFSFVHYFFVFLTFFDSLFFMPAFSTSVFHRALRFHQYWNIKSKPFFFPLNMSFLLYFGSDTRIHTVLALIEGALD